MSLPNAKPGRRGVCFTKTPLIPKMKTHSGAKKRFKLTAKGKVRGRHSFTSHILEKKSPKRKRRLGQPAHDLGGTEYAIALFHLGRLYMDRGDRQLARQYFERYLGEAPKASNTDSVRKLIAVLE